MSRREFTKATKRMALARSMGNCEAVGAWYGLEAGRRCAAPLSAGVEFDHIILDANSKDNSLENCAAVCIKCHKHKTAKHDTPTAAKTLRQQDLARGIKAPKQKIPARNDLRTKPARQPKQPMQPRKLFAPAPTNNRLWKVGQLEAASVRAVED